MTVERRASEHERQTAYVNGQERRAREREGERREKILCVLLAVRTIMRREHIEQAGLLIRMNKSLNLLYI